MCIRDSPSSAAAASTPTCAATARRGASTATGASRARTRTSTCRRRRSTTGSTTTARRPAVARTAPARPSNPRRPASTTASSTTRARTTTTTTAPRGSRRASSRARWRARRSCSSRPWPWPSRTRRPGPARASRTYGGDVLARQGTVGADVAPRDGAPVDVLEEARARGGPDPRLAAEALALAEVRVVDEDLFHATVAVPREPVQEVVHGEFRRVRVVEAHVQRRDEEEGPRPRPIRDQRCRRAPRGRAHARPAMALQRAFCRSQRPQCFRVVCLQTKDESLLKRARFAGRKGCPSSVTQSAAMLQVDAASCASLKVHTKITQPPSAAESCVGNTLVCRAAPAVRPRGVPSASCARLVAA